MEKASATFDFEWPHLQPGAIYYFPGNKEEQKKFNSLFLSKKEEVRGELLDFVKKEREFFYGSEDKHYPYSGRIGGGIIFYLDDNGRTFSLERGMLGNIINPHNLDFFDGNAVAFNAASKLVEILNPEIVTPKILHDKNKTFYYPLPKKVFYDLSLKDFEVFYSNFNLGQIESMDDSNPKVVKTKDGEVSISKEELRGVFFQNYIKQSWACSKIVTFAFEK